MVTPQHTKAKANHRQVGGSHYQHDDGGEQHWDRQWRLYGRGYFVGCITKYVERYHLKNGVQDLQKARHFLDKLIELEETELGTEGAVAVTARRESDMGNSFKISTTDDGSHPGRGYVNQD